MKPPMEIQDYLWRFIEYVIAICIILAVIFSFVFKNAYLFPFVFVATQFIVFIYCLGNFAFFKVVPDDQWFSMTAVFSFSSYLFNSLVLPFIFINLLISVLIYFNPTTIVTDYMQNYLFVYPVLFIFDAIFILFFYFLHKNATKIPQQKELEIKTEAI
jgi:hypothetical protein